MHRGEPHPGAHEAIVDRGLFAAVQAGLAAQALERRNRLRGSAAILAGRIFDDRGNRMTPTHCGKRGVRYRYYVSHPLLQKRKHEAGSVARVPAPEIEAMVMQALVGREAQACEQQGMALPNERALVERSLERVTVKRGEIEIRLIPKPADAAGNETAGMHSPIHDAGTEAATILLPWTAPSFTALKGVVHAPSERPGITPETRTALLTAIAKARGWIDDLVEGRATSFAEIAAREGKIERHIRNLAALAFVSPRIVKAIADATAPATLTVTRLANALPSLWSEQESRLATASNRPQGDVVE